MQKFKLSTAVALIKLLKNWPIFFLDRFNLLGKGEAIYRLRNGIKYTVRKKTADWCIINEVWIYKQYMEEFGISPDDIVFDIGANIGIFSVFAAHSAPRGKVFSFEPSDENFRMLQKNISANNLQNVVPSRKAVADSSGEREFFVTEITGNSSFCPDLTKTDVLKEKMSVSTIRLEDIFKEYSIQKVDFMKMDCEGAEYEIFFSAPDNVLSRIKKIAMEFHDIDDKRNSETLKSRLVKAGFAVTIKREGDPVCGYIYARRGN